MTTLQEYYIDKLYPLQDGILEIVGKLNSPFYLTGGTALGRCYFHHRYSDDLYFFVNAESGYLKHVKNIIQEIKACQATHGFVLVEDSVIIEDHFSRFVVSRQIDGVDCLLKIEFIDDVAAYIGEVNVLPSYGRVDNILNILTNKLCAVYRFEPKDIADIWVISKHVGFHWRDMIRYAKSKELGLDVLKISEIIRSTPPDQINTIQWANGIDRVKMMEELDVIAEDIYWGRTNRLFFSV